MPHPASQLAISPQVQDIQHKQFVDQPQRYVGRFVCFQLVRFILDFSALKGIMENEGMELEIITNPKTTDDGHSVIQVNSFPSLSFNT
jgi:hypothetical protein